MLFKALAIFAIWMAASCMWSPNPQKSIELFLRLVILFFIAFAASDFFLKLSAAQKEKLGCKLFYGFLLACLVTLFEICTDGSILTWLTNLVNPEKHYVFELWMVNRGVNFLVMLIWPVTYYAIKKQKKIMVSLLWILTIAVVFLSDSETAKLSLIVVTLSVLFILLLKQKALKLIAAGFILTTIGFVTFSYQMSPPDLAAKYDFLPASAKHRLCIWKFAADNAAEKIGGYGFDASRYFTDDNGKKCMHAGMMLPEVAGPINYGIALHPHNNLLQIWLELGAVGLALFLIVILVILRVIAQAKYDYFEKGALVGVIISFFMMGLTGYGIWQNWLIATLFLAVIFALVILPPQKTQKKTEKKTDKKTQRTTEKKS
jgi:O-antigen ligase